MAFIIEDDTVVSFAEPTDVSDKDQRIFDANESLTEEVVLTGVTRATERILSKLKVSSWWRKVNSSCTMSNLPDIDPSLIIGRQDDFTDLCVYIALSDYILPGLADFGDSESAERQKMMYYSTRADAMFIELSTAGDWYDADGDGSISSDEVLPTTYNLKRVR